MQDGGDLFLRNTGTWRSFQFFTRLTSSWGDRENGKLFRSYGPKIRLRSGNESVVGNFTLLKLRELHSRFLTITTTNCFSDVLDYADYVVVIRFTYAAYRPCTFHKIAADVLIIVVAGG